MEKTSDEVDVDEWDFLSDDEFLDINPQGKTGLNPKGVLDMDYVICQSPKSQRIIEPIRLESPVVKATDDVLVKEITKVPILEVGIIPPVISEKIKAVNFGAVAVDQDTVSQIFSKKVMENKFVDMKMDSPKSSKRGIKLQTEVVPIQFEEKEEANKGDPKTSAKVAIEQELTNKAYSDSNIKEERKWEGGGFNIWRWRLTGIGALCSVGVAAATICIFIFGSHQNYKHHHQNQKLRFQIYADDEKIKQVVHHANRLNQAISVARGVPLTRAHITFGGYYDGF